MSARDLGKTQPYIPIFTGEQTQEFKVNENSYNSNPNNSSRLSWISTEPIEQFKNLFITSSLHNPTKEDFEIFNAAKAMVLYQVLPNENQLDEVLNLINTLASKIEGLSSHDLRGLFQEEKFREIQLSLNVNTEVISPSKPTQFQTKKIPNLSQIGSQVVLAVVAFLGTLGLTKLGYEDNSNEGMTNIRVTTVELPNKDIHKPVSIELNSTSNTFSQLEKYFQQNPSDRSEWSAVYKLIKMSGIQQDLGNKPISILDFNQDSVSDKFLLGGIEFDLKEYLAEIRKNNVYPPCAFVESSKGNIYFNTPFVSYAKNNPASISKATLVDVFGSSINGESMLIKELSRNGLFVVPFQLTPLTLEAYTKLRKQQQGGTRMAGNTTSIKISSSSGK